MEIEWPEIGYKVTAIMLDDKNPELCDAIWGKLPFKTYQTHSIITGESFYCYVPFVIDAPVRFEEPISRMKLGRFRYSLGTGQKIAVSYGKCTETVKRPPIAETKPEEVVTLSSVGRSVGDALFYTKKLITVEFRRA